MKGTDVTFEQTGAQVQETVAYAADGSVSFVVSRSDIIRLLAWYGAIRAKSGRLNPLPLVQSKYNQPDADPNDESEGECGQCGRITSLVGGICDQCSLKNTIRDRDQRSVREMK